MNVLVVGGGGREHALCWALRRDAASAFSDDLTLFAQHYVLHERVDGLTRLRVVNIATGQSQPIQFPDPSYSVALENNAVFNTNVFRYGFESLRTPHSIYDYEMSAGQSTLPQLCETHSGQKKRLSTTHLELCAL